MSSYIQSRLGAKERTSSFLDGRLKEAVAAAVRCTRTATQVIGAYQKVQNVLDEVHSRTGFSMANAASLLDMGMDCFTVVPVSQVLHH